MEKIWGKGHAPIKKSKEVHVAMRGKTDRWKSQGTVWLKKYLGGSKGAKIRERSGEGVGGRKPGWRAFFKGDRWRLKEVVKEN